MMGFRFRVAIYDMEREDARLAVENAFILIREIAERVDVSNPDSELSKVSKQAQSGEAQLSDELFHIIKRAMDVSRKSQGGLDITSGPLRWLWEDYSARGFTPPREETHAAVAQLGYKHVQLNEDAKTVSFDRKNIVLDLHDVIRGFICDDVSWFLKKEMNVKTGLVSVDGSCMYLIGQPGASP